MKRYLTAPCIALLIALAGCATQVTTAMGTLGDLATLKQGESMRSSSSDPDWRNGNGDARPIAPGDTLVIADLEGPGVIRHIWNTIAAQELGYSRLLVIRMYWDGEEEPSVQCPIGDFFGIGHGMDVPHRTLPMQVSSAGRARNCYWPMPFAESARITVTNEGSKRVNAFYYYVDWQKLGRLPKDTAYFHASYRQEHPTFMGQNYMIADIEGRGHYVGTVLNIRQHEPSWWGEGDDFFFIDGEETPRLRGTGSEDYLCDAWGLREIEGLHYGVPVFEGFQPFSKTTAYRWHIADPVTFKKSLWVEIEHKGVRHDEKGQVISGFMERKDDFSSVAFWYQTEPHKPLPDLPPAYDRLYFDPNAVVEAETAVPAAEATAGPVMVQQGHWSGGGQLFWTPHEPEQTLTVPIEIQETGAYQILFLVTHSYDYGVFDFELDGESILRYRDLFNDSVVTKQHVAVTPRLTAGKHTLTIRNTGKNSRSDGYYFGLDGMILTKQ